MSYGKCNHDRYEDCPYGCHQGNQVNRYPARYDESSSEQTYRDGWGSRSSDSPWNDNSN